MTYPEPGPGFDDADLYRSVFHAAGVGMGVVEIGTGRLIRANSKLCELLGYRPNELIGMGFLELTHPDDRDRSRAEADRLVRGDIPRIELQKRYMRSDGTTLWAQLSATLLLDAAEQASHTIAIICDITSQKAAEQALQQSHERFRLITETVGAVFWLSEPGIRQLLYVSPAYEHLWGRSRTSLYQDPHSFADAIHPDDRSRVVEGFDEHASDEWEREYRIVRPDGTLRWICDRGYPVYDHTGELKALTGIAMDVTDRKSMELQLAETVRALHQNTKDLERMNRDLQQFASVVSHDLKAPLRAISGRVGMLSEDLGNNVASEVQEHLSTLQKRVRAMEGIITGLLQYSRTHKCSPREVNVRDLVLQQLESIDIPDGFTVEVDGNLPVVIADPLQMGQIFTNLIDNGIRHHDRPAGRITVSARALEHHHEFCVADDGPGIPEEETCRVFEMFESGRNHGAGSTGIGLALVKKLIEQNGGAIYLSSDERGSTFSFTWPHH